MKKVLISWIFDTFFLGKIIAVKEGYDGYINSDSSVGDDGWLETKPKLYIEKPQKKKKRKKPVADSSESAQYYSSSSESAEGYIETGG